MPDTKVNDKNLIRIIELSNSQNGEPEKCRGEESPTKNYSENSSNEENDEIRRGRECPYEDESARQA